MKKRFIAFLAAVSVLLCAWVWYGNSAVELNTYEIEAKVPKVFDDFTIIQISDLHNCEMGKNNKKVIEAIKKSDADIIVMTGDMIDSRNTRCDIVCSFAKEALEIAPCYFVTGNHEARVDAAGDEYESMKEELTRLGVVVLENESCEIAIGKDEITLIGLQDTGFDLGSRIDYLLKEAMPSDCDNYKILLAHRPEYFDLYEGVDLIFSGHAHGGQIRLPFIGGLFAPGQGVLPEYDGGVYEKDGRIMVVSRGLGNSLFPIRINNKPEVIAVNLKAK